MIALNKNFIGSDYGELGPEMEKVNSVLGRLEYYHLDHPHRKWEYAMAIRAMRSLVLGKPSVLDIGSGLSPFPLILYEAGFHVECLEIEDRPAEHDCWWFKPPWHKGKTVSDKFTFVTAISVIEHNKDPEKTLRSWWKLAKTGMFLTYDSSEDGRVLVPHVHYRTYTVQQMVELVGDLPNSVVEGGVDSTFHGYNVHGPSGSGAFGSAFVGRKPATKRTSKK